MNKEDLLNNLKLTDNYMLKDFEEALENEISNPEKKRDIKEIARLSDAICKLKGVELTNEELEDSKEKVFEKLNRKPIIFKRTTKFITATAVCIAALICLNQFTSYAFNVNIFPKFYERSGGGIVIHFDQDRLKMEENINKITQICAEHDIKEPIPSYLPAGFEITDYDYQSDILMIHLMKDDIRISFLYIFYSINDNYGIPSDTGNFREEIINGRSFIIATEDQQYRAVTISDKIYFHMTTYDLNYSEAEKIIRSLN